MNPSLGPYPRVRIVLCSADASPISQRKEPCEAAFFYPGASWVGAVRNAAEDERCKFVILTTAYGMVEPFDIIAPYDLHIDADTYQVQEKWKQTIPSLIGQGRYDILVFYPGGCPRGKYLRLLKPIVGENGVSLITFGRPNMFDSGKIADVVSCLCQGTSIEGLKSILKYPEYLEFFPVNISL